MKNRIVIRISVVVFLIVLAVSLITNVNLKLENKELKSDNLYLNDLNITFNKKIESLEIENNEIMDKKIELEMLLLISQKKYKKEKIPNDLTIELLNQKGIEDYKIILRDLENKSELISYDGVLGGSMSFIVEESILINEKYILAYFEDGHIGGYTLLEYSIDKNFSIKWSVIDSYIIE